MHPLGRIKCVWSAEIAYAVGLIATDGYISTDQKTISFTSKDKDQIINFLNAINFSASILKKARSNEEVKKYYHVYVCDVIFYRWLRGLGLTPNKSKTIPALPIPDHLFYDF